MRTKRGTAREGQITDRFTKAIEQLGSIDPNGRPKLELRLGAIYALERIARDSERDRWPVMEILTTYIRENSPSRDEPDPKVETQEHFRADLQAILTVLARREVKRETFEQTLQTLELSDSDLRGAYLSGDFSDTGFGACSCAGTHWGGAKLHGSAFTVADLRKADLSGTDLTGASLTGADLTGADLSYAQLKEARFGVAKLHGANLDKTHNLSQNQIDRTFGDANTKLPPGLTRPASWLK